MLALGLATFALLAQFHPPLEGVSLDELIARVPAIEQATENDAISDLFSALIRQQDRRAVPKLLPYLSNHGPRVRAFVSAVLNDLPLQEEDLDALIAAHRAGDQCALSAIGHVGSLRAARYVMSHVTTVDDFWKYAGRIPHDAPVAAEVVGFLRSPAPRPPDLVNELCQFVGSKRDSSSAPETLLAIALDSGLPLPNRLAAVHVLGCKGPSASASKTALAGLAAGDARFSEAVSESLDRLDGKKTLRTGLADLARATAGGFWRREDAIEALGSLGAAGRPAVPVLLPYLQLKLSQDDDDSRLPAIAALGSIGDPRAIPALVKVLDDPDDWRAVFVAAESLGRLGASEALPALDRVAVSHWFVTVRRMASYVAKEIRGPRHGLQAASALDRHELKVPPDDERATPESTAPPGTFGEDERSHHQLSRPRTPRPCDVPYPQPFLVMPAAELRTAEGTYFGIDQGEWGGELLFKQGDKMETILRRNVAAVVKLDANVLAVATRGVWVAPYAPPPGVVDNSNDIVVSNGPQSGALFRIERQPDGSHKAIPWKMLPGYCRGEPGILKDGRVFLNCKAGQVIVRPDGALERP
jgi:hypothetical protein